MLHGRLVPGVERARRPRPADSACGSAARRHVRALRVQAPSRTCSTASALRVLRRPTVVDALPGPAASASGPATGTVDPTPASCDGVGPGLYRVRIRTGPTRRAARKGTRGRPGACAAVAEGRTGTGTWAAGELRSEAVGHRRDSRQPNSLPACQRHRPRRSRARPPDVRVRARCGRWPHCRRRSSRRPRRATNADRKRLRRFVTALDKAGYLVVDPPPPRWTDEPVLDTSDATPISTSQLFQIPEGSSFLVDGRHFVWSDHSGTVRLRLTLAEMIAIRPFGAARTTDQAWTELSQDVTPAAMTRASFDDLVGRLRLSGLLRTADAATDERTSFEPTAKHARELVLEGVLEAVAEFEQTVMARPGRRVAVVPVNDDHNMAPLSLGLLVAYAQELDGGRLQGPLRLRPVVPRRGPHAARVDGASRRSSSSPTTSGTSSATSSSPRCSRTRTRESSRSTAGRAHRSTPATARTSSSRTRTSTSRFAARAKPPSPRSSTPWIPTTSATSRPSTTLPASSFRGAERRRPHARIATASLTSTPSPRRTCSGCSSRSAERTSRPSSSRTAAARTAAPSATGDRRRSPASASSTWIASRPSSSGSRRTSCCSSRLCDANFGIFERDVEIAEHIAELKKQVRLPEDGRAELRQEHDETPASDHRRLRERRASTIEPTVAVQSMDATTLKIIRRSNIKLEQYDELADEFRRCEACGSRPT